MQLWLHDTEEAQKPHESECPCQFQPTDSNNICSKSRTHLQKLSLEAFSAFIFFLYIFGSFFFLIIKAESYDNRVSLNLIHLKHQNLTKGLNSTICKLMKSYENPRYY